MGKWLLIVYSEVDVRSTLLESCLKPSQQSCIDWVADRAPSAVVAVDEESRVYRVFLGGDRVREGAL